MRYCYKLSLTIVRLDKDKVTKSTRVFARTTVGSTRTIREAKRKNFCYED